MPISAYCFVDSPRVKDGRRWYKGALPARTHNDAHGQATQFQRERGVDDYLEVVDRPDGCFELSLDGTTAYRPIFHVELPIGVLRRFARELANHLAQWTLDDWEGVTVAQLVPPAA